MGEYCSSPAYRLLMAFYVGLIMDAIVLVVILNVEYGIGICPIHGIEYIR